MTQVLSVSAFTAAYAMEAAKPARRVSTADQVKDARIEAEKNEIRKAGADAADVAGLIPAVALALDVSDSRNGATQQQHMTPRQAEDAYREI
ncbi:hypothetical protein [Rhizobium sp. SSA_523]|uniref:hypothetical protein n=1 Tax=Rhizobium sp. SSA_523 TaxID=2952477 RepID=UPI002090BB74|nr:hypothetical protein [Rhizobium sp. SSA_523]MCO5733869.1 hypothetical protein [Rhizobium sp. SSA_523]WKC24864.1 hypothetical protein QTJ18_12670 [Rhizobium sp. SSA_523]